MIEVLSKKQIALFAKAIDNWEVWRGTLVGDLDPEPLQKFDAQINRAKRALEQLRAQQKALRALNKATRSP